MFEVNPRMFGAIAVCAMSTVAADAFAGAIEYNPSGTSPDGCFANILDRNDDGSTGAVAIGFPINFYGVTYSTLFVNNNGNVTFDFPMSTYTPFNLYTANTKLIAPFFGDVDTRGSGSDVVRYGQTTFEGRPAFCVNWDGIGVGYYAARVDKLNKFQLIIVERGQPGSGNFDIIFNYDQIQWEAGQASGGVDGLGGFPARAGYSNGEAANSFEIPGSGVAGAFLDTNTGTGLVYNSRDSVVRGRYVFAVRSGGVEVGGTITGTVRSPLDNSGVGNAFIFASRTDNLDCIVGQTNAQGTYTLSGLSAGTWIVTAYPPAGSNLIHNDSAPFTVPGPTSVVNITLIPPAGIPTGTTIQPSTAGGGGVPTVYWHNPLLLTTHGCAGGTASYKVLLNGAVVREGPMVEAPSGTYTQTLEAFYPLHGYATIRLTLACPNANEGGTVDFNIYIDPSGRVFTTTGAPIQGASVTLLRSDSGDEGSFSIVPDGSAIMSPANRVNPMATDAFGGYGWDTIGGYYRVRVSAQGCTAPDGVSPYVDSRVVRVVHDAITDLDVQLRCGTQDTLAPEITAPHGALFAEATSASGAVVTYTVSAIDNVDGVVPVTCNPASGSTFPIGSTQVACTARDAAGNQSGRGFGVIVRDTTAPTLTLPSDFTAEATSAAGAAVTYSASASDAVSNVTPSCSPVSGSVFPIGPTTVSCSATDGAGNTASGSFVVTVADSTPPRLRLPGNLNATATDAGGTYVGFDASALDTVDGAVAVYCDPPSGSHFALGSTTVNCHATDAAHNVASGSFTVTVTVSFGGVLAPVHADGSSMFKAGRTIPIKFQLTGASAGITDAVAALSIALVSNDVVGTYTEAVSTSAASTGNLFRYDATAQQYIFNLSTSGLAQGTYWARIDFGDGQTHLIQFALVR